MPVGDRLAARDARAPWSRATRASSRPGSVRRWRDRDVWPLAVTGHPVRRPRCVRGHDTGSREHSRRRVTVWCKLRAAGSQQATRCGDTATHPMPSAGRAARRSWFASTERRSLLASPRCIAGITNHTTPVTPRGPSLSARSIHGPRRPGARRSTRTTGAPTRPSRATRCGTSRTERSSRCRPPSPHRVARRDQPAAGTRPAPECSPSTETNDHPRTTRQRPPATHRSRCPHTDGTPEDHDRARLPSPRVWSRRPPAHCLAAARRPEAPTTGPVAPDDADRRWMGRGDLATSLHQPVPWWAAAAAGS